ncbi:MAG: serine O-acetyltransferase EpsC [Bacteroidales bacterium]
MKSLDDIAQKLTYLQQHGNSVILHCNNHQKILYRSVKELVFHLRGLFFPNYFDESLTFNDSLLEFNKKKIAYLQNLLPPLIDKAFCFSNNEINTHASLSIAEITESFFEALPIIAETLITDVQATYNNDPAAKSLSEIILAYPGIRATISYRIAHQLYKTNVPILPRMIAEIAHSRTGIDIHPGARIGKHFVIDHGTGVVIGETAVIGDNVTIYQGVTLGAKNFQSDNNGILIKNQPRHPQIENKVTIYAGATLLGQITVGEGSVIGGNVWLTKSVPENSHINRNTTLHKSTSQSTFSQ